MEIGTILERALMLLWRTSWQASVLVLIVILFQILLGKRLTPLWRHALWLLVVVRLLLPVTPSSPWSLFNYWNLKPSVFTEVQPVTLGTPAAPASEYSTSAVTTPEMPVPETALAQPKQRPPKQPPREPSQSIFQSAFLALQPYLGWIWLIGALVLSMRLAWGNYLFGLQLRRRHPIADAAVLTLMDECRQVIGVRRPLTLLEAPELESPALFGCFGIQLLLPERIIETFSTEELRHVFLHELAHIRRRDASMNWLTTILLTLHWFNPIIWIAFRRMRADRELACDAMVLAHTRDGEGRPYGQTVIKVLEGFTKATAIPGLVGILEEKQEIKRRIRMITQFKKTSPRSAQAVILVIALGLISLTDAQTKKGAEEPAEPSVPGISSELTLRRLAELSDVSRFSISDISPDERYILGTQGGGDGPRDSRAMVIGIMSGSKRRFDLNVDRSTTPVALQFSPDGKQIVCFRLIRKDGSAELLLLDVETGAIRQMYRSEEFSRVWFQDWSSDGQTILAVIGKGQSGPREIAVISVSDGTARELTSSNTTRSYGNCAFSPDEQWIVYDYWPEGKYATNLRLMATDGSHDIALAEHPANDRLLCWPPSSDKIVFTSDRRGIGDAYTLQVADGKPIGDPVLLREIGQGVNPLHFARDGAFFFEKNITTMDVYSADIDPSSGKILSKPRKAALVEGRNQYPAWSPDGRFLAYIACDGHEGVIGIRDMQDGTVREIESDTARFSFPLWSSDGRSIFAMSLALGKCLVYQIDVDSGQATVVTSDVGLIFNAWPWWSWSPDGKSLYAGGYKAEFQES